MRVPRPLAAGRNTPRNVATRRPLLFGAGRASSPRMCRLLVYKGLDDQPVLLSEYVDAARPFLDIGI